MKGDGKYMYRVHQDLMHGLKDTFMEFGACFAVFVGNRCDFTTSDKDEAVRRARHWKGCAKNVRIRQVKI